MARSNTVIIQNFIILPYLILECKNRLSIQHISTPGNQKSDSYSIDILIPKISTWQIVCFKLWQHLFPLQCKISSANSPQHPRLQLYVPHIIFSFIFAC